MVTPPDKTWNMGKPCFTHSNLPPYIYVTLRGSYTPQVMRPVKTFTSYFINDTALPMDPNIHQIMGGIHNMYEHHIIPQRHIMDTYYQQPYKSPFPNYMPKMEMFILFNTQAESIIAGHLLSLVGTISTSPPNAAT